MSKGYIDMSLLSRLAAATRAWPTCPLHVKRPLHRGSGLRYESPIYCLVIGTSLFQSQLGVISANAALAPAWISSGVRSLVRRAIIQL
jgi:hypothetical protein